MSTPPSGVPINVQHGTWGFGFCIYHLTVKNIVRYTAGRIEKFFEYGVLSREAVDLRVDSPRIRSASNVGHQNPNRQLSERGRHQMLATDM